MRTSSKSERAMTLIELLVVIAIIGMLAALLLPALGKGRERAKVAKAQTAISGLATAFKAYYTEYGKWLIDDTTSNQTYVVDANLVALLQGKDVHSPPPATTIPVSATGSFQGNPRQIVFMNFNAQDIDRSTGAFVDPWGIPYRCRLDTSYANQIQDPFVTTTNITAGVLIWSDGPNKQEDQLGDQSALNKDNITSW